MSTLKLRVEQQTAPVQSEVLALTTVVRPILLGLLHSVRRDLVDEVGGYESLKLKMLPQLHNAGDGDVGICFEWAIHDAIRNNSPLILERVEDSLKKCKITRGQITSVLFGAEKSGALTLIDTANETLTDNSRLLTGIQAQPVKLKKHLPKLVGAFRNARTKPALPYSISGLWKADLFVGSRESDQWIGSTVKINPRDLEGAQGLRVGIIPTSQGRSDRVRIDETKNLIICPVPYDQSFMELFYTGWRVVQQFLFAKGKMPKEVALPSPVERQVAKELVDRLEFPVVDVVEVLEAQSQTSLLHSTDTSTGLVSEIGDKQQIETLIAPQPSIIK
jgi:hypothetical protein